MTRKEYLEVLENFLVINEGHENKGCPTGWHYNKEGRRVNEGCKWCETLIIEDNPDHHCPCCALGRKEAVEKAWEVIRRYKNDQS